MEALAYGKDLEKDIKVVRAKRAVTDMTLKLSQLKQTVKEAHTIANDMQTKKNEANQKNATYNFCWIENNCKLNGKNELWISYSRCNLLLHHSSSFLIAIVGSLHVGSNSRS